MRSRTWAEIDIVPDPDDPELVDGGRDEVHRRPIRRHDRVDLGATEYITSYRQIITDTCVRRLHQPFHHVTFKPNGVQVDATSIRTDLVAHRMRTPNIS